MNRRNLAVLSIVALALTGCVSMESFRQPVQAPMATSKSDPIEFFQALIRSLESAETSGLVFRANTRPRRSGASRELQSAVTIDFTDAGELYFLHEGRRDTWRPFVIPINMTEQMRNLCNAYGGVFRNDGWCSIDRGNWPLFFYRTGGLQAQGSGHFSLSFSPTLYAPPTMGDVRNQSWRTFATVHDFVTDKAYRQFELKEWKQRRELEAKRKKEAIELKEKLDRERQERLMTPAPIPTYQVYMPVTAEPPFDQREPEDSARGPGYPIEP